MTATQNPSSHDMWRAPSPAEGPTLVLPHNGVFPNNGVLPNNTPQHWAPPVQTFRSAQPFQQASPNHPAPPRWGPPVPPRSNAKMWAAIAGAAAVVATVSAVTIGVVANGSDTGGTPTTAARGSTTINAPVPTAESTTTAPTTETGEPEDPGPAPEPASLLLSTTELDRLLGGSAEKLGERSSLVDNSAVIDQSECMSAWGPVERQSYAGSGYDQVALEAFKDNDTRGSLLIEAAVSFPSSGEAEDYLSDAEDSWQSCAGRTVTAKNKDGKEMPWQFGVVDTGAAGLMTITQRPASGAAYGCERALGSSGRIVVDTMVCGGTPDGQATELARAIAENAEAEGA